jgi:hypothetical protein
MKIPKIIMALFLTAPLILLDVPVARAIRPLYSPFAVVAGSQYTAGYKDGSFNRARFNQPLGLTISDDGSRLFVADSLNNRIRVIHLDQNNEVGTVAGQDAAGNLDGPLTLAQFRDPRGVLYLPGDHLAVNDFGNQSLRFVDLKGGTVTTYRGGPVHLDGSDAPNPKATPAPTVTPSVPLSGIKDMAYLPASNSILFTQPEAGVLNALNLGTGQLTAVLKDNAQLPHPSALWIQENKIYIADRDLPSVYSMDWKNNAVTNIQPAGTPLDKVLSLGFSDNTLYGLLNKDGYPAERFQLDGRFKYDDESNKLVQFNNAWGDFVPPDQYYQESIQPCSPWVGFVPDPTCERKFFYSIPNVNIIVSLQDRFGRPGCNSLGLSDKEYPAQKPKNTYRILLCGDSRTVECHPFPFPTDSHLAVRPPVDPYFPENLTLAPQIEHELNFQAALDDNPMNYEFLCFGRVGQESLFWPANELPDEVKKLDIDLVIIFSPNLDGEAFPYYFIYNLTPDGVPQSPPNPEYVLKPPLERIPDGLPRKFYDYCKERNWVSVQGNYLRWDEHSILADPKLHDMVLEFLAKPWQVLNQKLSEVRTSGGKPVKLLILFSYTGWLSEDTYRTDMWKEVAEKDKVPYYDLNPFMNTLHLSYFPLTTDGVHLTPDGCVFFGKLLARVLPKEGLIPWPTPEKTPSK